MSLSLRMPFAAAILLAIPLQAAHANNYGEDRAWQFETTQDKVNRAVIEDLRQRKKNGMFAAPTYITNNNIEHQYNCTVAANAIGNQATNGQTANSPSTVGATSNATGNESNSHVNGSNPNTTSNTTGQDNSGGISSTIDGATSTDVNAGDVQQALNNTQTNSGNQDAGVTGSTGCAFGPLN